MTVSSSKASNRARPSPEAQAVFDLLLEVVATSFKLRAVGQRGGSVTAWGGGLWGLLHSLKTQGPQTVPQLARSRPVARQHIQKLADELAAEGLIEFTENPAHKRSKLLRMTPKGERQHHQISDDLLLLCRDFATGQDLEDLATSLNIIRDLKDGLSALLDPEMG